MSVITSASGDSCWNGLDYYKANKVTNIIKINDIEYKSTVSGNRKYKIHLNLNHPRKCSCNCPHAKDRRVICKHIVATYFAVVENSAKEFEELQERLQEEYENYEKEVYNNVGKYIEKMTKEQLISELSYFLDYAPEWVYDEFVKRNNLY